MECGPLCICWAIWKATNDIVFKDEMFILTKVSRGSTFNWNNATFKGFLLEDASTNKVEVIPYTRP